MIRIESSSRAQLKSRAPATAPWMIVASLIFMQAACRSDDVTQPLPTPAPAVVTSVNWNPGSSLSAFAGTAVQVPPSVTVKDQRGAGMGGITVTFSVSSGDGSITGETAATSLLGVATVGSWRLGNAPGTNTLTASVAGLSSVRFDAVGILDTTPCSGASNPYALGTTMNGAITTTDCLSDGVYHDSYGITVDQAGAYSFTQSASFDTYLSLTYHGGTIVADNLSFVPSPTMKVLLSPGSYVLNAGTIKFFQTGDYSLSSRITSSDVTGCELVYVARGVTSIQNIQDTDCPRANSAGYADEFHAYATPRQSLTVSMTSTTVDSFIDLYAVDHTGRRTFIGSNDSGDASGSKDARIAYTPANEGYIAIVARSSIDGQTGVYTLRIE